MNLLGQGSRVIYTKIICARRRLCIVPRIDFETFGRRIGLLTKKMTAILNLFTQEQPEVNALIDHSFLNEKVKRMYKRSYQERLKLRRTE